ncbi:cytochrome c biogenesis protein CcsA [Lentisphaerota bacterium WC36G]|nr:cytochrome c biogenesis protein CcsA [Lentisphaerae bacterium WC36]
MNLENLESIINLLKFVALSFFALSALSGIFSLIAKSKPVQKIAYITMFMAWLTSIAVFILNWAYTGHPPFGNMYHVLMTMGIFIPPLYLIVAKRDGYKFTHFLFSLVAVCALIGAIIISKKSSAVNWQQMPALQSKWFVPHVSSYVISYALMAVSFVLTIGGIFCKMMVSILYKEEAVAFEKTENQCFNASYSIVKLSYPFMTFGLFTGAVWADEIWGAYWSWDIKEVWSLITWSLYAMYLHMRFNSNFKQFIHGVQICAFAALICTFIIVNIMPKTGSRHTYSQTSSSHQD